MPRLEITTNDRVQIVKCGRIATVLYTVINSVIGVWGFKSLRPYKKFFENKRLEIGKRFRVRKKILMLKTR